MAYQRDTNVKDKIEPLKADKFLEAASNHFAPLRGTYVYEPIMRDCTAKTEQVDAGYGRWLRELLPYLVDQYSLKKRPRILDFGCGTGELTVLMNSLGFHATGVDVHRDHLTLARILAKENGLPSTTFVLNKQSELPFDESSFDIVTMFVVLEHLSDNVLDRILLELRRVCSGVVYVLVPNKLQTSDDHTGLRYVPWMPRWLATLYIKGRGSKHGYFISEDETWDVHYRTLGRMTDTFTKRGFRVEFPPDSLIYPPLDVVPPLFSSSKVRKTWKKPFHFCMRAVKNTLLRLGYPKEGFYPYLNMILIPEKRQEQS